MGWRYFYRDQAGDVVEFTDRVQHGWADNPATEGLVMNAEEGSVGSSTIRVEDPDGDWQIDGHRIVFVRDDDLEYDDYGGVVYIGYSAGQTIERDLMRTGAARIWTIVLTDINTVFDRRIMNGSDANRPAETDVERITWAEATNEGSLIDDTLYLSSDEPFDMDAVDYRGQSFRNIFDDCSQQSGKNWFLWRHDAEFSLWYAPRGTTDFVSDIKISNVEADARADPTGVFLPYLTTKLDRDPSRVFSGVYGAYANAHIYLQDDATAEQFARRDASASWPNVKTKRQATIRANRYLSDIDTQELIIRTAIIVPRLQTNDVVAGQRIQVKYTHFPGFEDYVWCRAVERTVRELGLDEVEIALKLVPDEPVDLDVGGIGAVFGILVRPKGYDAGQGASIPGLDKVWYDWVGDEPDTGGGFQPTVGLIEALSDPSGPLAPTWIYYGWKINGTGEVNLRWRCSTISITPDSVTFNILVNDVIVSSTTQSNGGSHGNDCDIVVTGLAVATNDVITTQLVFDPPDTPFSQAPRGIGTNNEYFCITGGSVL